MSDNPHNQLQDNSGAVLCPLEPSKFMELLRSQSFGLTLDAIEKHVSTSSECYHPPLKKIILHGPLEGTTLLHLACSFGAPDYVKLLVDDWKMDVETTAVYYSNPRHGLKKFGRATPLYVAAHCRHFQIVKYLVAKKADISSKSSYEFSSGDDGLTPLYGSMNNDRSNMDFWHLWGSSVAVFLLEAGADPNVLTTDGSPVWSPLYRRCDMVLMETMIHHGLNLDLRNSSGDTILHQLADKRNLPAPQHDENGIAVIQFLIQKGANPMALNRSGFTPALEAAYSRNWTLVDFFWKSNVISRVETIEAMEMAAARIMWQPSINDLELAFRYLRNALALRQLPTEPGPLHMTALKLKRGRIIGWTTTAELNHVIEEPSEFTLQSYLIQLRICSGRSWKAVFDLLDNDSYLYRCISDLKAQNRLTDVLDLLWATLETIQHHLLYHCEKIWKFADKVIVNLIGILSQLEQDDPLFCAETFKTMLEVLLAADRVYSSSAALRSDSHAHLDALFRMVTFLADLPNEILNHMVPMGSAEEQKRCIKGLLYQLVSHDSRRTTGQSLLRVACGDQHFDLATIRLLLEVNADSNAVDENGNAPLHVLASMRQGNGQVIASAARLLLENGAHLDRVNRERKTAAQLWKEKNMLQPLPSWLLEPGMVPKLKCLSAGIVRSNNIAYHSLPPLLAVPEILHPFLDLH